MASPGRPLKVHIDLDSLFYDVRDKSLEEIKKILHNHGINAFDDAKISAISCAAYHKRLDVIEYLVSEKADLNFQDKNGWTSLHWAVRAKSIGALELLINAGAEIDKQDNHGNTPLFRAVADYRKNEGELDVINYLLGSGADIKKNNHYEISPLSHIIDLHGSIIDGDNRKEWDLFFILSEEDKKNIAAIVAKKSNFQILSDFYLDELKKRLDNGMDVNYVNPAGNSLLSIASLHGHIKSIELLLEYGADLEVKCEGGATPVTFAARSIRPKALELLIARGADIQVKAENGMTALAFAAEYGRVEAVELLLSKGLDVNEKDNNGKSILDIAKKSENKVNRKKVVSILKKKGAL